MSSTQPAALICGSFAYDTIMVFGGKFADEILPDQVHKLNVSFLVPGMRREFGGCAGNIAFSLNLLGGNALPMGTVGKDFSHYARWMDMNGVSRQHVQELEEEFTAQAFITTDMDDNQICAFHPGAMNEAHQQTVPTDGSIKLGIVSPDGRQGMIDHANQFAAANIPFIFDPGQGLPMFDGPELLDFIEKATWLAVNDYECEMLKQRTGLSETELAEKVEAMIVTKGGQGSSIYANGSVINIPVASAAELKDPTGCGDAFRGGLLFGLLNGLDWETTGRIAALMGAIKIEKPGPQNHGLTMGDFEARYVQEFGSSFR